MISVIYYRKAHRLRVRGHAGSGRKGQDLVCAAVSALVLTAAGNIASLAAQGCLRGQRLRLEEGDADIACMPIRRLEPVVTLILDSICTGFQLLETNCPEYVRLTMAEGEAV